MNGRKVAASLIRRAIVIGWAARGQTRYVTRALVGRPVVVGRVQPDAEPDPSRRRRARRIAGTLIGRTVVIASAA
jgi:hypothetical protein